MKRYIYYNMRMVVDFSALVTSELCFCAPLKKGWGGWGGIILPPGKEKLRVVAADETSIALLMRP